MKKNSIFSRVGTLMLVICMIVSMVTGVSAATVDKATIDMDADCSITIYKYDRTNASKDGVWDGSYVSTARPDSTFEDQMEKSIRKGDTDHVNSLHNGNASNGYAIKGVEFSYLKVADIVTFTESKNDGHEAYNMTMVLYGFNKVEAADLLAAIGLADGSGRYVNADNTDKLDSTNNYYYTSDVLNNALAAALASNETTVKNALESYIAANTNSSAADATVAGKMPLTDEDGKTVVSGLDVGLYLLVETAVPEMVTETIAPFFVSLPTTDVNGSNWDEGGHNWLYNVTLYPKNSTGIVTLEKFVRESKADTGTHGNSGYGETYITDGWSHNATGSAGDVMEYQIISTLPTITSSVTNLSEYTFHDTIAAGLTYCMDDVKMEWFSDKACATDPVAVWDEEDGMFAVTYSEKNQKMTIAMTAAGLAAINTANTNDANNNDKGNAADGEHLYAAFSNYTVRVSYSAKVDSDNTFVYGDNGNDNTVSLTWKRSSGSYYDMLWDDCHVYSYGLNIEKLFSDKTQEEAAADGADGKSMYDHVKFKLQNATDGYFVQTKLNEEEGVYYVIGHTDDETLVTPFVPVTSYPGTDNAAYGQIIVKGLEDDAYIITELETADGYTLLQKNIQFTITAAEDDTRPCSIYADEAELGVYQNDGHYYFEGCPDLPLANIPQKQLAHVYLSAFATVDGNDVIMNNDTDPTTGEDTESANAIVPLSVTNTRGFNLPYTGEQTALFATVGGTMIFLAGMFSIFFVIAKRRKEEKEYSDIN